MQAKEKRIHILTTSEIKELYDIPIFNYADKEDYFSLDAETQKLVNQCRSVETKIYFILLLGYFRVKPIIFNFSFTDVKEDVDFIKKKYFDPAEKLNHDLPDDTKRKLINRLLKYTGYAQYKIKLHETELIDRLYDVAKINIEPRYVFDESLAFIGQNQITLVGYSTLQKIVSKILIGERERIQDKLNQNLSKDIKLILLKILKSDETFIEFAKLKKTAKDFSVSEIKRELATHQTIKSIYPELKLVISKLDLSVKNLEYYASLIKYKSLYRIRRHSQDQSLLYLICYLNFRYQETNDNLVSSFMYLVQKHSESAKTYSKKRILEETSIVKNKLKAAGGILSLFTDPNISDQIAFGEVRKKAFKLLTKDNMRTLSTHLDSNSFDGINYQWEFIDMHSNKVRKLIRSIFLSIDIEFENLKPELKDQFSISRNELNEIKTTKTINLELVGKQDKIHLEKHENTTNRFEYFLYRKTNSLFKSNLLTVKNSINNRSLAADLIDVEHWKKKDEIIKKTGMVKISEPINKTLIQKQLSLDSKLKTVSTRIFNGENQYVEYLQDENEIVWSIPNRKWQESIDNPIYNQIQHVGIVELISFVNDKTNFLNKFSHISKRKSRIKLEDLIACILGNGTNYGLYKMANISDRSVGKLRSVEDNYIRMATLKEANDSVSNAIASLPIFSHYNIDNNNLYSSIDGQKFECRINTFKARYSSKDNFKGKGVSALTLVSNHVPINAKLNGSNEYEGHFAFDLLYNNTSEIQPDVLSTDTHGTNKVNFAILDFFSYKFAPRYAKVKKIFSELFLVSEENNGQIILKKDINHKLIEQVW